MLNRTEFIETVLATNLLGAIAVPVNFRMTPPEIAFLVGDCEARVVVTESVLAGVATAVRASTPRWPTSSSRAEPPKTDCSATTTCSPRRVTHPHPWTFPTTRLR